jgi:hypothetical protein
MRPGRVTSHSSRIHPGAILKRLRQLEDKVKDLEARNGDAELLSTSQVCSLLDIHVNTWLGWLKKFPKPPARLGQPGSFRYRKSSVIRFAERIGRLSRGRASVINDQNSSLGDQANAR